MAFGGVAVAPLVLHARTARARVVAAHSVNTTPSVVVFGGLHRDVVGRLVCDPVGAIIICTPHLEHESECGQDSCDPCRYALVWQAVCESRQRRSLPADGLPHFFRVGTTLAQVADDSAQPTQFLHGKIGALEDLDGFIEEVEGAARYLTAPTAAGAFARTAAEDDPLRFPDGKARIKGRPAVFADGWYIGHSSILSQGCTNDYSSPRSQKGVSDAPR